MKQKTLRHLNFNPMNKRVLIFFLPLFFVLSANSQIIPETYRITWKPGIPGGIPEIESPASNILDFGADPNGVKDSYTAFASAIQSLPQSGGVVLIPEGTFRIGSKISISKNNVTFRGLGSKSRLIFNAADHCFEIVTYKRGAWQYLSSGVTKGVIAVKVPDASKFRIGQFAEIEQDNDSLLMYTNTDWIQSWGNNAVGQMFEIVGISGDSLTFRQPVNLSFTAKLNARIRPQDFIRNVGFENFYTEKKVAEGHTFFFNNSAYCWIRNVESKYTRKEHVNITSSLGLVIRDNYFHHSFSYGDGGSGYGVDCAFHATNCLVENNIFSTLRHAMMVHLGANGNVFGYNISIYPVQGEGETNLNKGWIPPDISVHGHFPFMNLFEGNRVEEIGISDYWGPSGPGNTFFRNNIVGEGIFLYDQSSYQNLVGNISTGLKDETGKSANILKHGNNIKGTVSWDPSVPDHNLPYSYYLDTVPAFFIGKPWPVFGPDIQGSAKLPAQSRLEGILSSTDGFENTLSIQIFPNPAQERLFILNTMKVTKISLLTITGECVLEKEVSQRPSLEINLKGIPSGLLLVKIFEDRFPIKTFKVIKK